MINNLLKIALLCTVISCDHKTSSDLLNEAAKAYESDSLDLAIKLVDQALEQSPKSLDAQLYSGDLKSYKEDYDGASINYQEALKIRPNTVQALFGLGYCAYFKGQYERAIWFFDRCMELKGGRNIYMDHNNDGVLGNQYDIKGVEILFYRGLSLYKSGRYEEAAFDLNHCVSKKFRFKTSMDFLRMASDSVSKRSNQDKPEEREKPNESGESLEEFFHNN